MSANRVDVVERCAVVIPAHNEAALIADCLTSARAAIDYAAHAYPSITFEIVVVLDDCTDETGSIATQFGARCVASTARRVGVARDLGIASAMASARKVGVSVHGLWIASTDADTTVPVHWLSAQLSFAMSGIDAVIGTVEPVISDLDLAAAWHERHDLREGHPHIHGANLGVRADALLAGGGFGGLPIHEDVALVRSIQTSGHRWLATDTTRVRTSGRLSGRLTGGFATYLTDLSHNVAELSTEGRAS